MLHHFPFRDDLKSATNPSIVGSGYTIKTAADRFTKANKAMKFNNDVIDKVILPNSVMHGLTDFTVMLWVNI